MMKIGDMVFTNDDLGIIREIGKNWILIYNNVNEYWILRTDIQEVV